MCSSDLPKNLKYCDVVMKGGLASGIVYPHAVCELSTQYQFKNIGGTSAGAIAAAVTAAAEWRGRAHIRVRVMSEMDGDRVCEIPGLCASTHAAM